MTLIFMIYGTDIGEIYATFGTYMAYIWIKLSPCISLIWFRYGFSQGQKACNDIIIVYISNFSQFRSRGGGHRKSIFSQIQKSPNYPRGGGGQENYGLFSTNYGIFYFEPSPYHNVWPHLHLSIFHFSTFSSWVPCT